MMETLKIALLAPEFLPNWGGVGTYSILLAKELSKTDEIHVFTIFRSMNGQQGKRKREIEAHFKDRVNVHMVSAARDTFWYNAIYQFNVARYLPRIIEKERFDIIHSNHAHMPDIGLKLRKTSGNSVTTVHTTLSSQFAGIRDSRGSISALEGSERMVKFGYPLLRYLEKFYLNKCRNLIYVSNFIQGEVEKIVKNPVARTRVVRNGVDLEHFKCPPPEEERDRLNVMFCGRLLALKGLNYLMDAFSEVHRNHNNTHLVIVGGGNIPQWAETAMACGIPKGAITFMGQKSYDDMPGIIKQADVFILPSMSESMPLSLLEAMACGRACVASRVGGIPEVISHGENGFLVEPGDPKDLAGRISELANDPGLRKRFGQRSRVHVIEDFNLVDMVKETRDMFSKVEAGGGI